MNDPSNNATFNHLSLCCLAQAKLLKGAKGVLADVGVICAFAIEDIDKLTDDILILQKVSASLVFIRKTIQEGNEVLLDFCRLRVEKDIKDALSRYLC